PKARRNDVATSWGNDTDSLPFCDSLFWPGFQTLVRFLIKIANKKTRLTHRRVGIHIYSSSFSRRELLN
ncbi:hypothetical protein QN363_05425, partial [Undibacterium sp. CCC2.1]|uniref:hypothetical protein n=1 Tax=unclassified Undibacterium TaxID=2630295 RepID=UPI002B22939E